MEVAYGSVLLSGREEQPALQQGREHEEGHGVTLKGGSGGRKGRETVGEGGESRLQRERKESGQRSGREDKGREGRADKGEERN